MAINRDGQDKSEAERAELSFVIQNPKSLYPVHPC
jgi:hypothetical protein